MKTTHTFSLATCLLIAACGGTNTTAAGGRGTGVTNPATTSGGQTITTAAGQAVSQSANTRFNEAASAMRTHDDANNGHGDWTPDVCNEIAGKFETAAGEQPNGNFPEAWFNRALVYQRCNMGEQATTALNRSVQAGNGNYCRAKVQLGVMAHRRHDVAAARAMFEEAIRQDPTHCVEGYSNLAMLLREANPTTEQQWGEVIRNIRAALALDDRYLPARNQLALSYLQQAGDDPNSQRIFLAGLVCAQAAQVEAASRDQLSADVRGFMADIHNTWGIIDIRRGEIIKALGHFQRAYQLNPTMFEAWINYGTINLSFRGFQDAREAFQHAVELRADSYDAHIGLGVALRGLARVDETPEPQRAGLITQAQAEYERARTLDANRPDAYYNLGVLNMSYLGGQIADLEHARDFLQQFQQRSGAQPRYVGHNTRATQHIRNIGETINAMRAMQSLQGTTGGTSGGTTPAAPATPPAGGAAPAPAPATPPAGGAAPAPAPAPAPAAH
jgi:tetratricopeptide (TPR) repeat protein